MSQEHDMTRDAHIHTVRGLIADAQVAFDEAQWETLEQIGASIHNHATRLKPKTLKTASWEDQRKVGAHLKGRTPWNKGLRKAG